MSVTAASSLRIPYVNIVAPYASLREELLEAVDRVFRHGQFILGEEVAEFEKEFAALCGARHAVGVNSGTDALILALRALGIGSGDEVITVPNSFVATASAIVLAGARPVFVDVRDDLNIDPDRIESAVTPRTKAILPVHLTGRPAAMAPIMEIATRRGLDVVEDAAQAVLASYRKRPVGSWGTIGCFSLHPLKTLSACGDGGVLTTNDEAIYRRLKTLRNLGLRTRDDCETWSGNSRLDTIQAALLRVKMKHLQSWTDRRRQNAALYRNRLAGIPSVKIPQDAPDACAVYHTFVIQTERRDELKARLDRRGIETAIHYPLPIHLQTAGKSLGYRPGDFPVAEAQAGRILSLPIYPELRPEHIDRISRTVAEFHGVDPEDLE